MRCRFRHLFDAKEELKVSENQVFPNAVMNETLKEL
jgi:hypothetical protein